MLLFRVVGETFLLRVQRRRFNQDLKEFIVKSGQGKDGAKKPAMKFPGLVKKLQAEAAKKAPKGDQGNSAFPYGFGQGKK